MSLDTEATHTMIANIMDAFPARPLDPERIIGDRCATYPDLDAFVSGLRGKTWLSLDDDFLERHHEILYFVPPAGFVDLLPAFLRACVLKLEQRAHRAEFISSMLRPDPDRPASLKAFTERVSLMTDAQRQAVVTWLEHLEKFFERAWADNPARDALNSYWRITANNKEVQK